MLEHGACRRFGQGRCGARDGPAARLALDGDQEARPPCIPRGARFVYLQSDYASPEFWHELVKRLLQHSASYGGGLAALMARGGVMPVRHFLIACGAPIAQKGHIPAQGVLDRLKSAQLVTCFDAPGIGECIELAQTVEATPWELNRLRARLNTEAVLLSAVKDWARNLALVSYNTVALRDTDDGQPRVGTFNWDLTGASYLGPLTQWDKAANKKSLVISSATCCSGSTSPHTSSSRSSINAPLCGRLRRWAAACRSL